MPSHVTGVRGSVPNRISVKAAEPYATPYKEPALFQTLGVDIGGNISIRTDGVSKKNADQEMIDKVINTKLPEEENLSWSEFAENSTFHGIKYIFNSGFVVRRIMWVLCVIGAIVLFITQVGSRTMDFFNYSTTVDVQLTYTDKIKFPAVTLCNQNNFRTSAMVDNGLYYFMDEIYSTTGGSSVNVSDYHFDQTDSVVFLRDVAHQFDDLVDQCMWNGHPCDRGDFVMTFTDVGVCFTFNVDRKSPLKVKDSGSAFGLTLILNVEQYEYMKGPNNDAGVKILLHDQTEFALMRDKGFAVAPGTHTIVIVDKGEVHSLPPPYGTCDASMVKETRSDCLRTCRTRQMMDQCGCMDAYMDNRTVNTRVCDVPILFGCVKQAKESGVISDTNCDCGIPCLRHTYEPTMSYAQLSQFNIERLVLVDPDNRARAAENFVLATEYSQRVVVDIANADTEQLTEIIQLIVALDDTVNNISRGFTSVERFQEIFDNPVPLDNYEEVFDPELWLLGALRSSINRNAETMFPGTEVDLVPRTQMQWLLEVPDNTMNGRLAGCDGLVTSRAFEPTFDPLGYYATYQGVWVDYVNEPYYDFPRSYEYYSNACQFYLDPDSYRGWWAMHYDALFSCYHHLDVCDVYIATKMRHAEHIRSEPSTYFDTQADKAAALRTNYMTFINTTFNDTYSNPDDIPEHLSCLDIIDAYAIAQDVPGRMAALLDNITNATSFPEITTDLEELEQLFSNQTTVSMDDVIVTCKWYHGYISRTNQNGICFGGANDEDHDCDNYREYVNTIQETVLYATAIELLFNGMSRTIRNMRTLSSVTLVGHLQDAIESYLDMNITKSELSAIVQSYRVKNALLDIASDGSDFISSSVEAIQQAQLLEMALHDAYTELFSLTLPLMSPTVVEEMAYIEYLRNRSNSEIDALLAGLHQAPLNATVAMIRQMYGVFTTELDTARGELHSRLGYLTEAASNLEDTLKEYTTNNRMNFKFYTDNFLQVDIFYKELSFERVEQQPSFPFLSLLSEVGGFLGLLLGASILTVCELLDWIVLTCSNKCRKKKSGEPPKDEPNNVARC